MQPLCLFKTSIHTAMDGIARALKQSCACLSYTSSIRQKRSILNENENLMHILYFLQLSIRGESTGYAWTTLFQRVVHLKCIFYLFYILVKHSETNAMIKFIIKLRLMTRLKSLHSKNVTCFASIYFTHSYWYHSHRFTDFFKI